MEVGDFEKYGFLELDEITGHKYVVAERKAEEVILRSVSIGDVWAVLQHCMCGIGLYLHASE